MSHVGVLVVDDQPLFRRAAREVIAATPSFVTLGEASSGETALAAAADLHPDLVLLDVRMPGIDSIATATELATDCVVVLTSVAGTPELSEGVTSFGAAALVRKQDLCPGLLRRVWMSHGHVAATP
jgi:DNA-binding NarL/FixJ family response regulator